MGNGSSKEKLSNGSSIFSGFAGNSKSRTRKSSKSKHKKKKIKLKPCQCKMFTTNKHCCKQLCLTEPNYYNTLTQKWRFTEEHRQELTVILRNEKINDIILIIGRFLNGINSTLEEYNIYRHGFTDVTDDNDSDNIGSFQNIPCLLWLKTKTKHIQIEFLGAEKVGKSALTLASAKSIYSNDANDIQSIYVKRLMIENIELKLRIFDNCLSAVTNTNGLSDLNFIYCMCVDPSSAQHFESFQSVKDTHYKLSQSYSQNAFNLVHDAITSAFIIVATKCDLKNHKYIRNSEMIITYCKDHNIPYIEISAKNGINMDTFLKTCVYELWIQTQSRCST